MRKKEENKSGIGTEETEGLLSNIQKFSIHDGPGIRTTVFTKGCPLKCQWCSNPESINPFPEIMTRFDQLCCHCDKCIEICPVGAIKTETAVKPDKRYLDRERCDLCMECVSACPNGALSRVGQIYDVEEVLAIVEQDRAFYETSGGGVTVSGGEPLHQLGFTRTLLMRCQQKKIHTVLDTSGYAGLKALEAVLPYCDLVLFDLKHVDPLVHRRGTGVGNQEILHNLEIISTRVPIWIRVPLIPGFNSDPDTLETILGMVKHLKTEKLCLMPYHDWSRPKYSSLGRPYSIGESNHISHETITRIEEQARKAGLTNLQIASNHLAKEAPESPGV